MTAFWVSLFFILIAEMGDKTQLVALAYATRYTAGTVMAGVFGATLLVHLFSVVIGETASLALPVVWIKLLAGFAFIGFGLWTLRGDELKDDEIERRNRFSPLLTVAITFFWPNLGIRPCWQRSRLPVSNKASWGSGWAVLWEWF